MTAAVHVNTGDHVDKVTSPSHPVPLPPPSPKVQRDIAHKGLRAMQVCVRSTKVPKVPAVAKTHVSGSQNLLQVQLVYEAKQRAKRFLTWCESIGVTVTLHADGQLTYEYPPGIDESLFQSTR
jgi:hypothetical protein